MKGMVVGISEAPTSHTAARAALELAASTGATVHFVTAVGDSEAVVWKVGSDSFVLDTVESARVAMKRIIDGFGATVPFTVEAVEGHPAKAIISVAERESADLIVVGNVRMQGIGRVLGSVGDDILRNAPCNVLIVKTV